MPPAHIGIIMDGNGRWAAQRRLPRSAGHLEGLKAAKRVVEAAAQSGVRVLSLYIFSTENWKRASEEVGYLMFLIKDHLMRELAFYQEMKVRIIHSGDRSGLPEDVLHELDEAVAATAGFDRMTLNLCINYGGRDEILRAVSALAKERLASGSDEPVSEAEFRARLDAPGLVDPDLIIRTSGEKRLSNFLLWGSAYAEFHFSDTLWPDWRKEDLALAIADYEGRKRLFGGKR